MQNTTRGEEVFSAGFLPFISRLHFFVEMLWPVHHNKEKSTMQQSRLHSFINHPTAPSLDVGQSSLVCSRERTLAQLKVMLGSLRRRCSVAQDVFADSLHISYGLLHLSSCPIFNDLMYRTVQKRTEISPKKLW